MPTHAEHRLLPYSQEQLFNLVADVERYPEFLPWCLGARVRERQGNVITADLLIGFKMVRERRSSLDTLSCSSSLIFTLPNAHFIRGGATAVERTEMKITIAIISTLIMFSE